MLLDIELAHGLAHDTAHERHGAFPARTVLLHPVHDAAEFEGLGAEVVAQLAGGTGDDLDLGVCLQVVEGCLGQDFLHLMDRLGLPHVHGVEAGESRGEEHVAPVDAGEVGHQLVVTHLVVVGVDVAQLHSAVAGFGDAGLDGHHCLHLLFGRVVVVAHHLEEVAHKGLVGLTYAHRLLVVVQIVVACAQSDATLAYAHDVLAGIALVGSHADAIHHGVLALVVEQCGDELVFAAVLDGGYLLKGGAQGLPSLTVQSHAVHHQVVERADFLA